MNNTPRFAIQPAAWGSFDEHGADYCISIAHAYKIAQGTTEDMMIFRLTTGNPIPWVRVYADESIDAVTPEALALLD